MLIRVQLSNARMGHNKRKSLRNNAGFTLVEALIAIAIIAFIFSVLAVLLQNTARAVGQIHSEIIVFEEQKSAAEALRYLFQAAHPPLYYGNSARLRGDAKSVFFTAAPSLIFGPANIRLAVVNAGAGKRLQIDAAPTVLDSDSPPVSAMMFDGAAAVTFSYYGAIDKKTPPVWRADWTQRHPPLLVAVDILFLTAARRSLHYEFHTPARTPAICPVEDPFCRAYDF